MHKLIFAGSVSTQQSPTQQFGSRLSWLVKVLLAMTILMGMKTVFAYSFVCQSASMLSPFADKIYLMQKLQGFRVVGVLLVQQAIAVALLL